MNCPHFSLPAGLLIASTLCSIAEPTIPAATQLEPTALASIPPLQASTALTIDDQGRILVAENLPVAPPTSTPDAGMAWYLDDLAVNQPAQRLALLDKWQGKFPPPLRALTTPQVRRFGDPNGAGVFQQANVIDIGLAAQVGGTLGGLHAHEETVFLGAPPEIRQFRKPVDGGAAKAEPMIGGLGLRVSCAGHGISGFTLGPDGRLYGTIGDFGLSYTSPSGTSQQLPNQGCAFRFEVDGSGFEIIHRGLRQPCGVAFDAAGNPFTLDAGAGHGDGTRVIYLVDGGDSGWRMEYQGLLDHSAALGLPNPPPVAWLEEQLWQPSHAVQPAYITPPAGLLTTLPSGLTYHPGTGLIESEAGRFLVGDRAVDPAKSGILSFAMTADGAGMKLADARPLVSGLTPADFEYSWDGKLIIADAASNRLLTLRAKDSPWQADAVADTAKLARENLDQHESGELLTLLKHPDLRIRLRAQFALTRKPDALKQFAAAIASDDPTQQLHGIWGTGILARRGNGVPLSAATKFADLPDNRLRINAGRQLVGLLKHYQSEVRAQAVRMLSESLNQFAKAPDRTLKPTGPQLEVLVTAEELPLAALLFDSAPRVRFFAAIAIGRFKATGFYGSVCEFLAANNNQDAYLRHAGSFALQHLVTNPLMLAGLERHPSAAVRMGAAVALRRMGVPEAATFINDSDPHVADEAIRSVTDLSLDEVRLPVAFLLDNLTARKWQPFMLRRLIHNAFRLGGAENVERLMKLVGDPTIPEPLQLEILRLFRTWPEPAPVDQLTGHWRPLAKRDPAEIKPLLTAELPRLFKLSGALRAAAIELNTLYQIKLPVPEAAPANP